MPYRRPPIRPTEGEEVHISLMGIETRDERLWISSEAVPEENFPPCIRNMLMRPKERAGAHRTAAILASFLGQSGYGEAEARALWSELTEGAGVEERIFAEWFQKMHCPKCETLKRECRGYPDMGIGDLGCCVPDERCGEFQGPVEYASGIRAAEDRSRGREMYIKTLYVARVFDWTRGREGEIELPEDVKDELESLQREMRENEVLVYTRARVKGRLRPRFFLKKEDGLRRRVLSEML